MREYSMRLNIFSVFFFVSFNTHFHFFIIRRLIFRVLTRKKEAEKKKNNLTNDMWSFIEWKATNIFEN